MLVIRESQLQSFIAQNDNDVVKLVCDALIKSNFERVMDVRPARLVAMAKIGIETAKRNGVTRPEDIASFVALMVEISPKFYRHPQVAAILAETQFPMTERIKSLPDRITDEQVEEITLAYDPKFWFPDVA